MPVFREALAATGLAKQDIGFWCSGSSDYLAGRAFSFVTAVDAIGAFPPIVRVARGDGRGLGALRGVREDPDRRGGDRARVRLRQVLGRRPAPGAGAATRPVRARAALARLGERRGAAGPARRSRPGCTASGTWPRSPRAAAPTRAGNPNAQVAGATTVDELLDAPYVADPLRAHDCAPVGDGAAAVVLAAGGTRPPAARAAGLDLRLRAPGRPAGPRRARPDHVAVGDRRGRGGAGLRRRRRRGRTARAVHPSGDPAARRARPGRPGPDQPVRRRAVRQPDVRRRAGPHRRGRPSRSCPAGRGGRPAHATSGPALQQNLVCVMEARSMRRAAVLGTGQTRAPQPAHRRVDGRACAARRSTGRWPTPAPTGRRSTPWCSARRPTCSRA